MDRPIARWLADEQVKRQGYLDQEFEVIVPYSVKGTSWSEFVQYTDSLFDRSDRTEFYHNLAVMKSAAFLAKRLGSSVTYTKQGPHRVCDLIAEKRFTRNGLELMTKTAVEIKQKTMHDTREKEFETFGMTCFRSCQDAGYNLEMQITQKFFSSTNIRSLFENLQTQIIESAVKGIPTFEDTTGLVKCTFIKREERNGRGTIRRPMLPYLRFWKNKGNTGVLDDALAQIRSTQEADKQIGLGMVVLDFGDLNFDYKDTIQFTRDWALKQTIPTQVIALRHPGMQEPKRTDFCDDFWELT